MSKTQISEGVVHKMPADMQAALMSDRSVLDRWEDLTPLARNEWICWTITVKQEATRKNHIKRTVTELLEGKRRPCCWIGCIHRKDKAISPSVKWTIEKQKKSS